VTYLIEYLGEFEFIFETVLGYVSGDRMGYFEAKKMESKISCLGTFKAADGNHLVMRPDSDGEGAGAVVQDSVGAVVERLKGWNQAAPTDPDKGGREQLVW
jgi:hypothetical protein